MHMVDDPVLKYNWCTYLIYTQYKSCPFGFTTIWYENHTYFLFKKLNFSTTDLQKNYMKKKKEAQRCWKTDLISQIKLLLPT